MSEKQFPISDVYNQEASKLLNARSSVQIIHKTGNIDASGDELEMPFRNMLQKRLPAKFHIGHGHIVDANLNVSPQFDVIITDSSATPILFDGENGTQYFPYESVYAVGEVKSTYYKNKKYVEKYISSVKELLNNFSREPVDPNYIGHGITLAENFTVNNARKIQNPLFSFMIFGTKNDCKLQELDSKLESDSSPANPNIMCFLDGSIITKAHLTKTPTSYQLGKLELDPLKQINKSLRLVEINFSNQDKSGQALSLLMLSIFQHLTQTRLKSPPFEKYIEKILSTAQYDGTAIRFQ